MTLGGIEWRLGRKGSRCWGDFQTEKGCGKSVNRRCMISKAGERVKRYWTKRVTSPKGA